MRDPDDTRGPVRLPDTGIRGQGCPPWSWPLAARLCAARGDGRRLGLRRRAGTAARRDREARRPVPVVLSRQDQRGRAAAGAAARSDADSWQTAIYQRVAIHPNVKRYEPLDRALREAARRRYRAREGGRRRRIRVRAGGGVAEGRDGTDAGDSRRRRSATASPTTASARSRRSCSIRRST